MLATCHPDRLHKAYGLCSACYQAQRHTPAKAKQYGPELVEYLESHPGATWTSLASVFGGRTRKSFKDALKRQFRNDLTARVDKTSGVGENTVKPYRHALVQMIETNVGIDWPYLERMFGRTRHNLKSVLYNTTPPRKDLIWLVGNNTKED